MLQAAIIIFLFFLSLYTPCLFPESTSVMTADRIVEQGKIVVGSWAVIATIILIKTI